MRIRHKPQSISISSIKHSIFKYINLIKFKFNIIRILKNIYIIKTFFINFNTKIIYKYTNLSIVTKHNKEFNIIIPSLVSSLASPVGRSSFRNSLTKILLINFGIINYPTRRPVRGRSRHFPKPLYNRLFRRRHFPNSPTWQRAKSTFPKPLYTDRVVDGAIHTDFSRRVGILYGKLQM